MRLQAVILFAFGLFLLTLENGCATKALWQNGNLEAWKQPDTDPHLQLFDAKQSNDILVVYNEYSERNDATRTHAYWLHQNQKLINDRRAPHFVAMNKADGCIAIPVFAGGSNERHSPPYALLATNGQSFTLHSSDDVIESHDLPFYNDHQGTVEKFALTPLASAADITIVGGILGYWWLQGAAASDANYSFRP